MAEVWHYEVMERTCYLTSCMEKSRSVCKLLCYKLKHLEQYPITTFQHENKWLYRQIFGPPFNLCRCKFSYYWKGQGISGSHLDKRSIISATVNTFWSQTWKIEVIMQVPQYSTFLSQKYDLFLLLFWVIFEEIGKRTYDWIIN